MSHGSALNRIVVFTGHLSFALRKGIVLPDKAIDTGAVAAREVVSCAPFSTVKGLPLKPDEAGVELVRSTLAGVLHGTAVASPQEAGGLLMRQRIWQFSDPAFMRECVGLP